MVDGIDKAGAVDPTRLRPATVSTPAQATAAPAASAPAVAAETATNTAQVANLISLLADAAPPIDTKKVEAIRSLIASGAYPIDERAIAAKMLALDFPGRGENADA